MGELYFRGDSIYHHIHPSAKIVFLVLYSFTALILQHPLYNFSFLILSLILIAIGGFPFSHLKQFLVLLPVVLMPAVIWPFWLEGEVVLSIPIIFTRLTITDFGLLFGFTMVCRFLSFLPPVIIFLSSTQQREIIHGLHGLKVPFKASLVLSLILRYIPVSRVDFQHANAAQFCRRKAKNSGKFQRIKDKLLLIVPVFFSMMQRASTLSDILELRGIGNSKNRTYYNYKGMEGKDRLFILAVTIIFVSALAVRLLGYAQIMEGML